MRNRTILILLLLLGAVYLVVKFDLITQAKIIAANILYGEELRHIKGFRVVVEVDNPELKKEGLSEESVRQGFITRLEKAGINILDEETWKKVPERPVFNLRIIANKNKEGLNSFVITMEVTKSDIKMNGSNIYSTERVKTIWSTSGMGEGNVMSIREKIDELTSLFLKAHTGI
jgi:hypothetical protein